MYRGKAADSIYSKMQQKDPSQIPVFLFPSYTRRDQ
jgi:hypothetical protein